MHQPEVNTRKTNVMVLLEILERSLKDKHPVTWGI